MSRRPGPSAERVIALGLVALGALLVLSSASRPRVAVAGATLQSGQADVPGGTALALVALAGAAATLLLRGVLRNVVGGLVAAAGVAVLVLDLAARNDVTTVAITTFTPLPRAPHLTLTVWFWLTAAGAAMVAIGGAAIAVRAQRWRSARRDFDAPTGARPTRRDAWSALDRGEDPTL